jgi:iron complex transport system substrate-binding protein
MLLFGREPGALRGMFASAGRGFLHDMLEVAGGQDAFADVGRQSLQVSVEVLLARAPDVIIEMHPAAGWTPERIAAERLLWNALGGVPAVRNDRVHIVTDDALPVPGPRVVHGIQLLVRVLHPDAGHASAERIDDSRFQILRQFPGSDSRFQIVDSR